MILYIRLHVLPPTRVSNTILVRISYYYITGRNDSFYVTLKYYYLDGIREKGQERLV